MKKYLLAAALLFVSSYAFAQVIGGPVVTGGSSGVQSLTTSGSSGPSTLTGTVLNIPVYSGGSSLTVTTTTTAGAGNPTFATTTGTTTSLFIDPNFSINNGALSALSLTVSGNATLTALTASTVTAGTFTGNNAALTGTTTANNLTVTGNTVLAGTTTSGAINSNSNITLFTTTAATSGSTQKVSPNLTLQGNYWNGSTSTPQTASVSFTPTTGNTASTRGTFGFNGPSGNTVGINVLFNFANTFIDAENSNDSESGSFGETFNAAQFGMSNYSGSTQGVIPANTRYAFLIMSQSGVVGTSQQVPGNPSYRNVLDDGSAGAKVGLGVSSPSDKLDVAGGIGLTTTTATVPTAGMYSPTASALSLTATGISYLSLTTTTINLPQGTTGAMLCLTSAGAIGHCTAASSCLTTCTCTCAAN